MSTAVLVGKGPSLDTVDWAALLEECRDFYYINESYLVGEKYDAPITGLFAQDRLLLLHLQEHAPDGPAIITHTPQEYRGQPERMMFREPWIEHNTGTQYITTAHLAISYLASIGVTRLIMVGFDALDWDTEPMTAKYAVEVEALGISWSVDRRECAARALWIGAQTIKRLIAEYGIERVSPCTANS